MMLQILSIWQPVQHKSNRWPLHCLPVLVAYHLLTPYFTSHTLQTILDEKHHIPQTAELSPQLADTVSCQQPTRKPTCISQWYCTHHRTAMAVYDFPASQTPSKLYHCSGCQQTFKTKQLKKNHKKWVSYTLIIAIQHFLLAVVHVTRSKLHSLCSVSSRNWHITLCIHHHQQTHHHQCASSL